MTGDKYRTKPGEHGTLYLHRIVYRDDGPACPDFEVKLWAYSIEHAIERFYDDPDDGWRALRVSRVLANGLRHRETFHDV